MFTTDKAVRYINSAMPTDSEDWFGKQPPDLSLMARAKRGADYLYSFSMASTPTRPGRGA